MGSILKTLLIRRGCFTQWWCWKGSPIHLQRYTIGTPHSEGWAERDNCNVCHTQCSGLNSILCKLCWIFWANAVLYHADYCSRECCVEKQCILKLFWDECNVLGLKHQDERQRCRLKESSWKILRLGSVQRAFGRWFVIGGPQFGPVRVTGTSTSSGWWSRRRLESICVTSIQREEGPYVVKPKPKLMPPVGSVISCKKVRWNGSVLHITGREAGGFDWRTFPTYLSLPGENKGRKKEKSITAHSARQSFNPSSSKENFSWLFLGV